MKYHSLSIPGQNRIDKDRAVTGQYQTKKLVKNDNNIFIRFVQFREKIARVGGQKKLRPKVYFAKCTWF